jgi:tRNA-dihydrouridine synthase
LSDWSEIANLVSRLKVPVAASGDLFTPESAEKMLRETGCAAIMFARGALGNPFIFSETKSLLLKGSWTQPTRKERLETALEQLRLRVPDRGERSACLEMRKQFCAYVKGMKGGAALRRDFIKAETIEDYERIISKAEQA